MARTSRRKVKTSSLRQLLEAKYSEYMEEAVKRADAGLIDGERLLSFNEWSEDFCASNL